MVEDSIEVAMSKTVNTIVYIFNETVFWLILIYLFFFVTPLYVSSMTVNDFVILQISDVFTDVS